MPPPTPDRPRNRPEGRWPEVFWVFLRLGLSAFGGPVAHLGYFHAECVRRRRWLPEPDFADLLALCQFLPGPASSQLGFALGLRRAGWAGGLAAFLGFTLPSALVMAALALALRAKGPARLSPLPGAAFPGADLPGAALAGALAGLKILAVAIVAQALWAMARSLCPDRARAGIALAAALLLALWPSGWAPAAAMMLAIGAGALAGLWAQAGKPPPKDASPGALPPRPAWRGPALALVAGLLLALALAGLAPFSRLAAVSAALAQAGALVFGGGHVVLALLQGGMVAPGWVSAEDFLAGYGAAQALPGPLFTFGTYLGAMAAPQPLLGAALGTLAIFAPGFLLLLAVLPFWARLSRMAPARALMAGANAAVVGVLGAAFYDPVFTTAITGPASFAVALLGFLALQAWKAPPWALVLAAALGGAIWGVIGG